MRRHGHDQRDDSPDHSPFWLGLGLGLGLGSGLGLVGLGLGLGLASTPTRTRTPTPTRTLTRCLRIVLTTLVFTAVLIAAGHSAACLCFVHEGTVHR